MSAATDILSPEAVTGAHGSSLQRLVRPLCRPRKRHLCRLCDEWVEAGEPCERWTGFHDGAPFTSHAHPECYAMTAKWDSGDWECCAPGDVTRPKMPNIGIERQTEPDTNKNA